MWESTSHVLTAVVTSVLTATFVGALAAAYVKIINARRTVRADEVGVLHKEIDNLRGDRDAEKKELADVRAEMAKDRKVRDKELSEIKSEHTAALIGLERCKVAEQNLRDQNADLLRRVAAVEAELAGFRGDG